jgi:hypothetical protein
MDGRVLMHIRFEAAGEARRTSATVVLLVKRALVGINGGGAARVQERWLLSVLEKIHFDIRMMASPSFSMCSVTRLKDKTAAAV